MKAIKILKKIYKNNPDTRIQRNNVDVNFTIHDFNNIKEAIKELEDLQNRSCDTCKSKFCSIKRILTREDEINSNYFYCNDWEKQV